MAEMIRAKCSTGHIVITDNAVCLETKLLGQKNRMMSRASLTGVDIMPYPKLLGIGGKYADLTFYGTGNAIKAKVVKIDKAREIVALLGY